MPINGFPLTRTQRDGPQGIEYTLWLTGREGAYAVSVTNAEAVCFVFVSDQTAIESCLKDLSGWALRPLALKSLSLKPVMGLYCKNLKVYWEVLKRLEAEQISLMEEDIRPVDRYLMERFIRTGAIQVETDNGVELRPFDFTPDLKLLSLDIETTLNANQLLSIGLQQGDQSLVLFNGEAPDLGWCEGCVDERALLQRFVEVVAEWDPDLIVGWNLIGFDLRVLARRAKANRVGLTLGRDASEMHVDVGQNGRWFSRIAGRVAIDGIETLKGATWQFDSFSLESVAQALLGRGKAIDNPYDRGEKIQQLFREDKQALATYNIEDCRLVLEIFKKAELLEYLIERSRLTGLALDKVGGSQAAFDNLYLPKLHRAGYVAPPYASGRNDLSVPGGFVMESKPGLYRHVLVFDFKSLYPSIIRTFSVDPLALALASEASESSLVPGFFGAQFNADVAILPAIIEELWLARDRAKAHGNSALSQAIKIQMNACYGVLGSNVCRFYDQNLSGAITLRGHELLQKTAKWFESEHGHQVIYGDTDSVFVLLGDDYQESDVAQYGAELADQANHWLKEHLKQQYGVESALELQYESHFKRFLMPTMRHSDKGTKKRYAGLKASASGDQLVFKGLETVRSDWTPLAKKFQTELLSKIFNDESWRDLVVETTEQVLSGKADHLLIYRRRLRRPLDAYQVSNPPHVKAAKKMQSHLEKQGLNVRLGRGDPIEYVMTVNGPEPVICRTSIIDYQHYVSKQLEPVADTVLPFLGASFNDLIDKQRALF
jgi:DNA polymerase-2